MALWDLANADCIVVMGSNMAENHPVAFRFVTEAQQRGAIVAHVDPRFTRTSAIADIHAPIRSGTDIAFLGGIIRYILANDLWFRDFALAYTNIATIIEAGYRDAEDNAGVFSGFDEKNARPMGRATRGTRGIELRQDDYVVSVCAVSAEDKERMLSVSEQGYGKQTPITTYRLQSRGGKGVINMKTTDKTGKVVAVFPVEDESEIMIITQQGKLIRIEANDIRKTGRSAQGVRLIKTDAGDKVTSASLVEAAAEEETEELSTN